MATLYPEWKYINALRVKPEDGEIYLLRYLENELSEEFEIFFNPYLDGDRPDIVILRKGHGATIIEVKDWDISNYTIDGNNNWSVKNSIIRSPQQQVFRYKFNLFELHLPTLGMAELSNKNFFNVITVFVYFHNAKKDELSSIYDKASIVLTQERKKLNNQIKDIPFNEYEKSFDFCTRKIKQLQRDRVISIARDELEVKVKKIKDIKKNILFTDDIYKDFRRRLLPPTKVLEEGVKIPFDAKQSSLANSTPGFSKIKGVAGCGKTSILAQRAINALKRHGGKVLILSYNITVRFYIKDVISRFAGRNLDNEISVIHYHGFINNMLNQFNMSINDIIKRIPENVKNDIVENGGNLIDSLYSFQDLFDGIDTQRFDSIFIDEVQDYEPDWIKIIRKYFVNENGEMVLFGDQSQNIYDRDDSKRESSIVYGFGSWNKLTKSYRSSLDAPLLSMFSSFQKKFLVSKYKDSEIFEYTPKQSGLSFDLLKYEYSDKPFDAYTIVGKINEYVIQNEIHPNDITIISSHVDPLYRINNIISESESTKIVFETKEELDAVDLHSSNKENRLQELEKIRRRKKNFFYQNSGVIKLSTIHSFKGLESDTVFMIIWPGDIPEVVYTGITRSKKNLVVFDFKDSIYKDFFDKEMT